MSIVSELRSCKWWQSWRLHGVSPAMMVGFAFIGVKCTFSDLLHLSHKLLKATVCLSHRRSRWSSISALKSTATLILRTLFWDKMYCTSHEVKVFNPYRNCNTASTKNWVAYRVMEGLIFLMLCTEQSGITKTQTQHGQRRLTDQSIITPRFLTTLFEVRDHEAIFMLERWIGWDDQGLEV